MVQNNGVPADAYETEGIESYLAARPDDSRRIDVRPITSADQDEFLDLMSVSADLHHPWVSLPSTPERFEAHLSRYEEPHEESLVIRVRATGIIAGLVTINSIVRGRFQCGSIAYAAFSPSVGKGYLSEGLDLVVRYAFEGLRLHRLEAQIQPDNLSSLKLVRRIGFRQEGYSPELLFVDGSWRGHERWAITNTMISIVPTEPHPALPVH